MSSLIRAQLVGVCCFCASPNPLLAAPSIFCRPESPYLTQHTPIAFFARSLPLTRLVHLAWSAFFVALSHSAPGHGKRRRSRVMIRQRHRDRSATDPPPLPPQTPRYTSPCDLVAPRSATQARRDSPTRTRGAHIPCGQEIATI